jgi:hypothetical protein
MFYTKARWNVSSHLDRAAPLAASVLAALLLFGSVAPNEARGQVASATAIFLMIEPDSRSAGMGNTGVALADNANAIFWNPAGLGFQRGTEFGLTHSTWLPKLNAGLYYEYLVGKHHIDGVGTVGGHVTYLFLGQHECRTANNVLCGTFNSYDLAAGATFARQFSDRFSLGTSVRGIYSKLADGRKNLSVKPGISVGVDLAGLYRSSTFDLGGIDTRARAGFNLANMGPSISYLEADSASAPDPIPTNLRFGYSFTFDFDEYNSLTFSNDFTKILTDVQEEVQGDSLVAGEPRPWYEAVFSSWRSIQVDPNTSDTDPGRKLSVIDQLLVGVGAEYWYNQLFALRGGYFYEHPFNGNREFLTLGAGLRYNIFGVDFSYIYALEENNPLANTMRFSVLFNLGE